MMKWIRENKERLVSIGECGLDYSPHVLGERPSTSKGQAQANSLPCIGQVHKGKTELKEYQKKIFMEHVQLSKELDLPLNVHSRNAGHYTIDALVEGGCQRAVLHAFDGKEQYVRRGIEAGFHFSVPPSVVR
jgi:TatD DNase family protein